MSIPKVGDRAEFTKTITDQDVRDFARVSGDVNPVHLDDAYAAKTRFKKRIAHGMLGAALLSKVMGTQMPGPGTIYLSQTLKFKAPVYLDDAVTAVVEVIAVKPDKPIFTLSTKCLNQKGEVVLEGEAVGLYEPV